TRSAPQLRPVPAARTASKAPPRVPCRKPPTARLPPIRLSACRSSRWVVVALVPHVARGPLARHTPSLGAGPAVQGARLPNTAGRAPPLSRPSRARSRPARHQPLPQLGHSLSHGFEVAELKRCRQLRALGAERVVEAAGKVGAAVGVDRQTARGLVAGGARGWTPPPGAIQAAEGGVADRGSARGTARQRPRARDRALAISR